MRLFFFFFFLNYYYTSLFISVLLVGEWNGNQAVKSISLKEKAEQLWRLDALRFPSEHMDDMKNYQEELNRYNLRKRVMLGE